MKYIFFIFNVLFFISCIQCSESKTPSCIDLLKKFCIGLTNQTVEQKNLPTSRNVQLLQELPQRNDISSMPRLIELDYGRHDSGTKEIGAERIDSDTVLVAALGFKDGSKKIVASSYMIEDGEKQLAEFKSYIQQRKPSVLHVAVLVAGYDRAKKIEHSTNFWQQYYDCVVDKSLLPTGHSFLDLMPYTMVPGSSYRKKDHLTIYVNAEEVYWKSAMDDFKKHSLLTKEKLTHYLELDAAKK